MKIHSSLSRGAVKIDQEQVVRRRGGEGFVAKVDELAALHGKYVRELIQTGRIPEKQIANFFGRHPKRREVILSYMRKGYSYSKAYSASDGTFDTKTWMKVSNRTAACRGLVLTTLVELASAYRGSPRLTATERQELRRLTDEINRNAVTLIRALACCKLMPSPAGKAHPNRENKSCYPVSTKVAASFTKMRAGLATAASKLKKNCRDVPQMFNMLGELPSVKNVAQITVEAGRILGGVPLLLGALEGGVRAASNVKVGITIDDTWGIGNEYACHLREEPAEVPLTVIVTHRDPDADALTAAWLVDRQLFLNQACCVEFVARNFTNSKEHGPACVVDVGCEHDPSRLRFDHKPPAFNHRDEECATSLVWRHAQKLGRRVKHLNGIVRLIHDGDAASRRQTSDAYQESRQTGLHALVRCARAYSQSDRMLYKGIAVWLDALSKME